LYLLLQHGEFLYGDEKMKRFVNVHLHCIVSNMKTIGKMSMFHPPLQKFIRAPMVTASFKTFIQACTTYGP